MPKPTDKALGTTLATIAADAKSYNTTLNGVKFKCTRGSTVLVFRVDCWISSIVIQQLMERDGWRVEEIRI